MTELPKHQPTLKAEPRSRFLLDVDGDSWTGRSLNARYQMSRRLAAGPSGDVYRAHDGETGAGVTIKLLPATVELDEASVRRLRDELSVTRAIARIRPNVAIVRDCDRTPDGRVFVVIEALDGRSLADLLREEGALPLDRALRFGLQIAEGLQAAHSLVLVHGALDAEHVIVGPHDSVKLIGFEAARLPVELETRAMDATPAEKPSRMLPLTERADLHAFGALLSDMIAGVSRRDANGRRARAALDLKVPEGVRDVVTQTMADTPGADEIDMTAVANRLWVEIHRASQPRMAWIRRPARTVWRQTQWRTAGLGLVLGATVTLTAWTLWFHAGTLTSLWSHRVAPPAQTPERRAAAPPEQARTSEGVPTIAPAAPPPLPAPPEPAMKSQATPALVPRTPPSATTATPPAASVTGPEPPRSAATSPPTLPAPSPRAVIPPAKPTTSAPKPSVGATTPARPTTVGTTSSTAGEPAPPRATPPRASPPDVAIVPVPARPEASRGPVEPAAPTPPSRDAEARRDPDPSAIVDWFFNDYSRQRR